MPSPVRIAHRFLQRAARVRHALSLPDFDIWAKTVTFMAKAEKIEWGDKVEAKASGNRASLTIPFRYKRPKARWKDAALYITVTVTPGIFGNNDREGVSVKTMIGGL